MSSPRARSPIGPVARRTWDDCAGGSSSVTGEAAAAVEVALATATSSSAGGWSEAIDACTGRAAGFVDRSPGFPSVLVREARLQLRHHHHPAGRSTERVACACMFDVCVQDTNGMISPSNQLRENTQQGNAARARFLQIGSQRLGS